MAGKRHQSDDFAKFVRWMKVLAVLAVVACIFVMVARGIQSREMAKTRAVATRAFGAAGSATTRDFFATYADCFNSSPVYRFTCEYDPDANVLFFSGDFSAQGWNPYGDLGQNADWQVDNVLPEIVRSIGPRIKELNAIELSNFLADDVGQTAVWRARLPLSALSTSTLESEDDTREYIARHLRVYEDTATGRHLGTAHR